MAARRGVAFALGLEHDLVGHVAIAHDRGLWASDALEVAVPLRCMELPPLLEGDPALIVLSRLEPQPSVGLVREVVAGRATRLGADVLDEPEPGQDPHDLARDERDADALVDAVGEQQDPGLLRGHEDSDDHAVEVFLCEVEQLPRHHGIEGATGFGHVNLLGV